MTSEETIIELEDDQNNVEQEDQEQINDDVIDLANRFDPDGGVDGDNEDE